VIPSATAAAPGRPALARRAFFVVMLAGATLRLLALGKPFYIDEIVTMTVATQPIGSMGAVMRQIDASPALYPLLLHVWLAVSHSDLWTRLLSAAFGIAAVYVVYRLGRRAFGERTGLLAAGLMALAPAHVEYAQYVRSYSLFTLLAALQVLVFMRCLDVGSADEDRSAAPFVWFAAATAALFYTHYLSALILLPEGLFAAWRLRAMPGRVLRCGAAVAVAVALFAPGIPLLGHNLEFDRARNADRPPPPPAYVLLPNLLADLSLGPKPLGFSHPTVRRATLGAGLVIFPVLLVAGAAAGWRSRRDATVLLLLVAFLPMLVYVLSGRRLVAVRFFLPFAVAYVALLAHGLASFGRRTRLALLAAVTVVCVIPLVHFTRDFEWSYDHHAVARAIEARWQPGDAMLFVHPYEAFYYRWYLGPEPAMTGLVFTALEDQGTYVIKPASITLERAEPRVLAAARAHDRLWIVGQTTRSFASDPIEEARVLAWMDATFHRLDDLNGLTHADPVVRLYRVARTP
jgi:mannosyltransferase